MSDASRPAKRARRTPAPTKPHASRTSSKNGVTTSTTTSTTAASPTKAPNGAAAAADAEEEDERPTTPLPYVPNRAIPPIAPTPPSECPLLPQGRRATIVSRRYDPETMRPLYRVRIEPAPRHGSFPAGEDEDEDRGRRRTQMAGGTYGGDGMNSGEGSTAAAEEKEGDGDAEEHTAPLADILSWVSPAELERFELVWEDDVVVMVDEDGAVLLVSREAQRAMMGWPSELPPAAPAPDAAAAAAGGHGAAPAMLKKKGRKKQPTKEFVDLLPPKRKVVKTAEIMGVVGGDGENDAEESGEAAVDTASETAEYGEWVNPANVRGTASESVVPDRGDERDELALSDASDDEDPLVKWRAGGGALLTERPLSSSGGTRRNVRSTTSSRGSSRADVAQRDGADRNGSIAPSETSLPASPVRRSMSSRGAGLRRSSMSSNNSAAPSFRTADSRRPSMRSSAALSRSSSGTGAENRAASLLSAFHSTQKPSSRRQAAEKDHPNGGDPVASPRAVKSSATKSKDSKHRRASITVPTTSALHQASSMLHPPAEGSSWEPEMELEEEEEEYEIESIIRDRLFGNKWYYLVKWANWPPDEQSWFTEEELEGAREVLDAYLERVRGKKTKKEKGSRKGKERAVLDEDGDFEMVR